MRWQTCDFSHIVVERQKVNLLIRLSRRLTFYQRSNLRVIGEIKGFTKHGIQSLIGTRIGGAKPVYCYLISSWSHAGGTDGEGPRTVGLHRLEGRFLWLRDWFARDTTISCFNCIILICILYDYVPNNLMAGILFSFPGTLEDGHMNPTT